ncbi:MAG: 50S ribosomal protein L16 [archaeon]
MAKLIRAVAWRRHERPFTRKSKFRKKSFVRAVPANKIVKYDMGNLRKDFKYVLTLKSKADVQLRHNALESARKTSNKALESKLGKVGYRLKIRVYPHHVLRNNPLAAGAGADRMSTGMKASFGKSVGLAAQVDKGQSVIDVFVDKNGLKTAKLALQRASKKFPCGFKIEEREV